jgi:hypothetical protein
MSKTRIDAIDAIHDIHLEFDCPDAHKLVNLVKALLQSHSRVPLRGKACLANLDQTCDVVFLS